MDNRREFLKQASILAGASGLANILPESIQKAMAINPAPGSTYLDAEHIVILMQENRSFDHTYGALRGVRGFNDPRVPKQPNGLPVWLQTNKDGDTFAPFHLDIKDSNATWMSSLPHSWSNQVDARNNGRYDGWLDAKHSGNKAYRQMPLTMGFYKRQDIPFYYALADAFTVCDQNFCSSLTGTTPNRLYFWSGTIREKMKADILARVWNGDADYDNWANWKTYPERLEENGVSWKVYQNEISVGVGFNGEEDAWLANFTDNPLEFFSQYNVKLSPAYIANLPKAAAQLKAEIEKMTTTLATVSGDEKAALQRKLTDYKAYLNRIEADQKNYTLEKFGQLSPFEKNIHQKAFSNNSKDPHYHELTTLKYMDGSTEREVQVPKGDVLYQFREDVHSGKLPTVSWLVAPENFSDHPGAAWYGSWYISEVMDILTKNPEVWKKTIFILAYDENDGYFDHVPPFVVPDPANPESGKTSAGIDASLEFVTRRQQSSSPDETRESPIGLGFRVPLVIASPWSRGGWVNSQVFDHTSTLQFLEKFLQHKTGKRIEESNITAWRRAICGDLTTTFRPYNGEKIEFPKSLDRDEVVENIHKAKFKGLPSKYKKLSAADLEQVKANPKMSGIIPAQEEGTRSACAIPYELYVDGHLSRDKSTFELVMASGKQVFGERSAGSAFNVYLPSGYKNERFQTRAYTVVAGDILKDSWSVSEFANNSYHLCVYGPNGFYREFSGDAKSDSPEIRCSYEKSAQTKKLTGNISLNLKNNSRQAMELEIVDNAYKAPTVYKKIAAGPSDSTVVLSLGKSDHWYDFSVRIKGQSGFLARYAGHVETGSYSSSDPAMGNAG